MGTGNRVKSGWGSRLTLRNARPKSRWTYIFFRVATAVYSRWISRTRFGPRRVNVCAMVRADVGSNFAKVFLQHPALRQRSLGWQPLISTVSTAPLIFAKPRPERDGVLLAGDAAGFVDPFVGDGISSALRSGWLAAQSLADFFRGGFSPTSRITVSPDLRARTRPGVSGIVKYPSNAVPATQRAQAAPACSGKYTRHHAVSGEQDSVINPASRGLRLLRVSARPRLHGHCRAQKEFDRREIAKEIFHVAIVEHALQPKTRGNRGMHDTGGALAQFPSRFECAASPAYPRLRCGSGSTAHLARPPECEKTPAACLRA